MVNKYDKYLHERHIPSDMAACLSPYNTIIDFLCPWHFLFLRHNLSVYEIPKFTGNTRNIKVTGKRKSIIINCRLFQVDTRMIFLHIHSLPKQFWNKKKATANDAQLGMCDRAIDYLWAKSLGTWYSRWLRFYNHYSNCYRLIPWYFEK